MLDTAKVYTVKSNARRDCRKYGADPDRVHAVDGGFMIRPDVPPASAKAAKLAELKDALGDDWVTVDSLKGRFGWRAHTVRGRLSDLGRSGVPIERRRVDGVTSYRIAGNP